MIGHGAKFGRKKEAAIAALLTQRTAEDAARSVGIAPATLRQWQKDPEFDSAFRVAKVNAYRQTIARMHQLSRHTRMMRTVTRRIDNLENLLGMAAARRPCRVWVVRLFGRELALDDDRVR